MKLKTALTMTAFVTLLVSAAAPSARADEWGDKLSRGLVNIISSPVEIGRTIINVSEDEGPAEGWTLGLVQGIGRTVLRLGAGIVEVVTFPFDWPDDGKEPLITPEYAWQGGDMDVDG